jgi:hypothetical protein
VKESDIRKYALEWHEKTGLYYLPRGKMPTKIPIWAVSLFTTKPRTQFDRARASLRLERGFKRRVAANCYRGASWFRVAAGGLACLTTDSDERLIASTIQNRIFVVAGADRGLL